MFSAGYKRFFFLHIFVVLGFGLLFLKNIMIPTHEIVTFFDRFLLFSYVALGLVGQFGLLALVLVLVLSIVAWCRLSGKWLAGLTIILSTLFIYALFVDALVFRIYHYHINGMLLTLFFSEASTEIFQLSNSEWRLAGLVFVVFLVLEATLLFLCCRAWQFQVSSLLKRLKVVVVTSFVFSLLLYMLAFSVPAQSPRDMLRNQSILMFSQHLPLYSHFLQWVTFGQIKLEDFEGKSSTVFYQPDRINQPLNYPLQSMNCSVKDKKPKNILVLGIDTLRFDVIESETMPNVADFATGSTYFSEHYSGGNSTLPGLVSLFYSLPASYWTALMRQEQGPVLFQEFAKQNYQIGAFVSANSATPPYNKTVFRDIPNFEHKKPGETPGERDAYVKRQLEEFLVQSKQSDKPFFGFVFFNSPHGYCEPQPFKGVFEPTVRDCQRLFMNRDDDSSLYWNRYRNALHYTDGLIGEILQTLKQLGLEEETIVFVLGDHGEEFNEERHDYWGHASNYFAYQLRTPLIVRWPGRKPEKVTRRTSHYQFVPTLLSRVLGCSNAVEDYSVGEDLFDAAATERFWAGSYVDFAVWHPDKITRVFPSGRYQQYDHDYNILTEPLNLDDMRFARNLMSRYYT